MQGIESPLFESERLALTAHRPQQDAALEAQWSEDLSYTRSTTLQAEAVPPSSEAQVREAHLERGKRKAKAPSSYSFAVRTRTEERLIGFARLEHIDWHNGTCLAWAGVGAAADRRKGYATEALGLLLRYAFDELDLHRVGAHVSENNAAALGLLAKLGFQVEVRRREALFFSGRRWDQLSLGLLRPEWRATRKGERP